MTEIFLKKIQDSAEMQKIVKKYPSTPAFSFIQKELLELQWNKAHNLARGELELFIFRLDILEIIRRAISWYMYSTVSYGNTYSNANYFYHGFKNFLTCPIFEIFWKYENFGSHVTNVVWTMSESSTWSRRQKPNERRSSTWHIFFFQLVSWKSIVETWYFFTMASITVLRTVLQLDYKYFASAKIPFPRGDNTSQDVISVLLLTPSVTRLSAEQRHFLKRKKLETSWKGQRVGSWDSCSSSPRCFLVSWR